MKQTSMSENTKKPNADTLSMLTSTDDTHKENSSSEPLMEHKQIDNSPLTITGNATDGYFIRLGDYRLTTTKPTINEAYEALLMEDWSIILGMIIAVVDKNNKDRMPQIEAYKNTQNGE